MNITFHDCFAAALDLFGRAWPALGPLIISVGILLVIGMGRELWRAGR